MHGWRWVLVSLPVSILACGGTTTTTMVPGDASAPDVARIEDASATDAPPPSRTDGGPACSGSPRPETCDGTDENCNGLIDDGFDLACARCASDPDTCVDAVVTGGGWRAGIARNLITGGDVGIRLPPVPRASDYLYVSNSGEATVSKLRIDDGTEMARIQVGFNPSRTAVDGDGNAWVAMRGSITDTPDAVREGVVKIDGSCTPSVAPPVPTRECILLDVPDVGHTLRGLAVDAMGDVWVASWATDELVHLDGQTGAELARVSMAGHAKPYGLAIDEDGYLWVSSRGETDYVVRVDPLEGGLDPEFELDGTDLHERPYGIASDGNGHVWFGTFGREVFSVDSHTGMPGSRFVVGGATRGVAIDDSGSVWAADSSLNALLHVDPTSGMVLATVPVGAGPVGVAVDADGNVWGVSTADDSATKVGPDGTVIGTYPVGRTPYTYSDMAGTAFRVFRHLRGVFRATYDTGYRGARWESVDWTGMAPPPSTVAMRVRAADGAPAGDWQPVTLDGMHGTFTATGAQIEVEITLSSDDRNAIPEIDSLHFVYRR